MLRSFFVVLFMVAALSAGCSSEPDFVVRTSAEDADAAFNPVSAQARFRADTRKVLFTLTNFAVDDEWYRKPLGEKMTQASQRYIMFSIPGESGVPYKEMLKPGAHDVQHVEILTYKEGPGYDRTNLDRDNHEGNITITEVTDTEVKGTIDVSDASGVAVKGDFTATRT